MRALALVLALAFATPAPGEVATSPRPEARPGPSGTADAADPVLEADAGTATAPSRPLPRPDGLTPAPQGDPVAAQRPLARSGTRPTLARGYDTTPLRRAEEELFAFSPLALLRSARPVVRPARITQQAVERQLAIQRGQLCGDPAIQGQVVGAVAGSGACGIDSAVRVRSVAGVTLTPNPTVDCRTASALKAWVAQGAKPAVGQIGGGVTSLRIVSHYACRNRNNGSGGRLSEHAFGRAIDVAGIGLKNGQEITVLTDWGRGDRGQALRAMWRAACGPFGTVLGPEANRYHRDHFHFDTARYRSGSYCR